MFADLPPNSKVIGLRFSLCEFRMTMYPTSVDPVKEILLIPLCVEMYDPVYPNPVRMLTTPAGSPAWLKRLLNIKAVKGVCSAGFITIVHPAARAGATFQLNIKSG